MMVIAAHDANRLDEWQQTRFLAWINACTVTPKEDRVSLFEFLPLAGDPSKEEQEKMKEQAAKNEYDELKRQANEGTEFVKMLQQAALKAQSKMKAD